jgi:uncharacterized RDD family membrane protein YckC
MTSAERLCLVAARSEGLLVDFVFVFLLRWGLKLLGFGYVYYQPVLAGIDLPITLQDFSHPAGALFYGSMYFASGLPMLVFAGMWCLYGIIALSLFGQTLGMRQAGLMLVDQKGRKPAFLRVVVRQLLVPVSSIALWGFVFSGFTPNAEAFHDLVSRTRIVYAPKRNAA